MPPRAWPLLVPCLACLAACGGRSDLTAAIAGSGDAGTTKTASDGGAGAPGCHAWSVAPGGPVALTDPDLDSFGGTYASDRSASAAVEGSRVFVSTWDASGNIYPSPDQSWHVRVVADDLATMGPSQIVLHHGDEGGDAMALASGFGHRAGFGFDESKGCVFVPLADDGSAAGAPKTIAADECFWPRATPDGFTVFLIPDWVPFVLVTLDASGNVLAQEPGLGPPGGMVANARARIPDGSTLITWPSVAAAITARRWSAAGDALSPPEVFLSMPAVDAAPMTVVGGAVLVAWAPYSGDVGAVRVQPANEDGDPLGPPVTIAAADGVHVDSLDITTAGGGALAIWTKQEMGGSVTTVQPLTAEGLPEGAPIVLPTTPTVQSSYIVGTPAGAMIEFDGNQPGGHTQAFVTRLVCEE